LCGGKHAQVGDIPALSPAGAAGGLTKHHDVPGRGLGDAQEQPNAVVVVGDNQLTDGVRAKNHWVGGSQQHLEAEAGAGAVDALEMLLAGQGAGLAEALGALDLGAGLTPGDTLGLGKQSGPGAGKAAKRLARMVAGR
jgi:hypothetical protein